MSRYPSQQYNVNRETIPVKKDDGKQLDVNIFRAENGPEGNNPILVAGGWGTKAELLKRVALWMTIEKGETTITVEHDRSALRDGETALLRRANTLRAAGRGALDHLGASQLDVFGHSIGSVDAVNYALQTLQSEDEGESEVGLVTLVTPAGILRQTKEQLKGLSNAEGTSALAGQAIGAYWDGVGAMLSPWGMWTAADRFQHRITRASALLDSASTHVSDSPPLAEQEIGEVAAHNAIPGITTLHDSGKTPVLVIPGERDEMFNSRKIRAALPSRIPVESVRTSHLGIFLESEERAQVYHLFDKHRRQKTGNIALNAHNLSA